MPVEVTGITIVQDENGNQHTIDGGDFDITENVGSDNENPQGQRVYHQAKYNSEIGFVVTVDIYEYPTNAYETHTIDCEEAVK
jgi:hypothetical protein